MRRAGVGYWEHIDYLAHEDWEAFRGFRNDQGEYGMLTDDTRSKHDVHIPMSDFFFTRFASTSILDVDSWPTDRPIFLYFGAETFGLTDEITHDFQSGQWGLELGLPMHQPDIMRCHNLASSATMALWHVYASIARQLR